MIKEFFFKIFQKVFAKEITAKLQEQIVHYNNRINEERSASKRLCETVELEQFVGAPVICVSNEHDNFIVGFGVRIEYITEAQQPMLVVKSYIDGQEYMPFGKVFLYNSDLLFSMFLLQRSALNALLYKNYSQDNLNNKPAEGYIYTHAEFTDILEENGFYAELLHKDILEEN